MHKNTALAITICFLLFCINITHTMAAGVVNTMSGEDALVLLKKNNALYVKSSHNSSNISIKHRQETSKNGQAPYAIVLGCADSRVPPEHVFNAGVGELFVIRNAGNITSRTVLGSMEYAIEHLGVKLIVVLGHTKCGAVGAAFEHDGQKYGIPSSLQSVIYDINSRISSAKNIHEAEIMNINNEIKEIHADPTLEKFIKENNVLVVGGIYDISTGKVKFSEDR